MGPPATTEAASWEMAVEHNQVSLSTIIGDESGQHRRER